MLVVTQDLERLITVVLHTDGALSVADVDELVAANRRSAALLETRADRSATVLVIVESEHGPDAAQRKRIAEAAAQVSRCVEAHVTTSSVNRAMMTAIRWMLPRDPARRRETFDTYDEAVTYLVAHTGHPPEAFAALVARARQGLSEPRGSAPGGGARGARRAH